MKAHLMHKDQDFPFGGDLPWGSDELIDDLELKTLFTAMAHGDVFLFEVAQKAVMTSLREPQQIAYRQDVLRDCVANPDMVRELYRISIDAIEIKKRSQFGLFVYPDAMLMTALELMQAFMSVLLKLRDVAYRSAGRFRSEGFMTFFTMIQRELADEYFEALQGHLKELGFRKGTLISARLGNGNKGISYVLRKPDQAEGNVLKRFFGRNSPSLTFHIADRDDAGSRALSELRVRGTNLAADAVAQSADHVLSFFRMLQTELAFYLGCLNLIGDLDEKSRSMCYPVPSPVQERRHSCTGLYDVCLSLRIETVVPNDARADGADLILVTGANEGGKSTFLRSIGVAQMMMQAGMVVGATSFGANVCDGLFTHYKRKEDASMASGKFDEELLRMNAIAKHVRPGSLVLFNESFAATNEREGSEVARQIVQALVEKRVKVFFVTHMYEFSNGLHETMKDRAAFLRAERREGGKRTFKVSPGEPLQTSFGEDLYRQIFTDYGHVAKGAASDA
ncbi:MutS-related protein [Paraburkholderia fungorum]|uniref:MutS-related protein n=1 Tax=Paraburkholderia fungorum TaxID=134537 RepID=UPI00402BDCE1